jgi:hypothetical protein
LHRIRLAIPAALLLAALAAPALAGSSAITVYKTPTCGCCTKWIDHLEANGFEVSAVDVPDTWPIKEKHGVPVELAACHTALVDGYVVEGHVPAADVTRLLRERPDVKGLAVPDMPIGSPGMEGSDPTRHERYEVLSFDAEGKTKVFETHGP